MACARFAGGVSYSSCIQQVDNKMYHLSHIEILVEEASALQHMHAGMLMLCYAFAHGNNDNSSADAWQTQNLQSAHLPPSCDVL